MSWSKITKSKERGGLGIKDLRLMNECLILKWWWRFGVERNSLWRKVICSKYKLDVISWLPSSAPNRALSILWKDIVFVGQRDENLFRLFWSNVKISVGNGRSIRFWHDVWVGDAALHSVFPRIFNVCSQKQVIVGDVVQGRGSYVNISLELRRGMYDWEQEEWSNLITLLNSVVLHPDKVDALEWRADKANNFSVNSLYRCIEAEGNGLRKDLTYMWKNVAPPKVQFLGWLAMLGRVKTSELLLNLGILSDFNMSLCHFCGEVPESVNHLFLHCDMVWHVWCVVLRWWKVEWVVPASVKSLFCWWRGWKFKKIKRVLWELSSFAVLWSVWKMRNELIFQGVAPKWEEVGDLIKYRIACWMKTYRGPGSRDVSHGDVVFRFRALIEAL